MSSNAGARTSRVPVEVETVRALLASINRLQRAVRSNGRIHAADRVAMLRELSVASKPLADLLQLSLFSPAQLDL